MMYRSCDDPSKLLAYDASVYNFRISELISSFGYLSVNDAVFRKFFTTAFSPLMYVSGSFAYLLLLGRLEQLHKKYRVWY
jgi:hypothetical protein